MRGGKHHLGVEAHTARDLRAQAPQRAARHAHGQEDLCRKAQAAEKLAVPVARRCPHQRRCGRVGVLVGLLAAEQEVEVVGHHEEGARGGQLLGVLALEGAELVGRVERLVLYARARVVVREGQHARALKLLAHALGARVAVANGLAKATVMGVKQHEVHAPGVNAYRGGRETLLVCGRQPVEDALPQRIDVPAQMAIAAEEAVLEAVDLGEPQATRLVKLAHDGATA